MTLRLLTFRTVVCLAALAAVAGALLLTLAASTVDAVQRPVLFHDSRATVEPRSVDASKIITRRGGPPYDETIYQARNLRWSGWGSSSATGRGRITYCVVDRRPCSTRRGSVTVSTIWQNGCGDISRPAYRYVRWNFPGFRSKKIESMPSC